MGRVPNLLDQVVNLKVIKHFIVDLELVSKETINLIDFQDVYSILKPADFATFDINFYPEFASIQSYNYLSCFSIFHSAQGFFDSFTPISLKGSLAFLMAMSLSLPSF